MGADTGTRTTRLHLAADPAPELIERVCRLLRHRGAAVVELHVRATDPATTHLDVGLGPAGDIENLVRQLRRLADVRSVEVIA